MEKENIKNMREDINIRAEINYDGEGRVYGFIEWNPDKKTTVSAVIKGGHFVYFIEKKRWFFLKETDVYEDSICPYDDKEEEDFFGLIRRTYGDEKCRYFFNLIKMFKRKQSEEGYYGTGRHTFLFMDLEDKIYKKREYGRMIYYNDENNETRRIFFVGAKTDSYDGKIIFVFYLTIENEKEKIIRNVVYNPRTNEVDAKGELYDDKQTKMVDERYIADDPNKEEKEAIIKYIEENYNKTQPSETYFVRHVMFEDLYDTL